MKPLVWQGCYDEGWKGVIVPEAFAHPAKFSRGLITERKSFFRRLAEKKGSPRIDYEEVLICRRPE